MIRAKRRSAAFLAGAIVLSGLSTSVMAQDAQGVDRLLPEETIFVFSIDDMDAFSKASESMPLSKIMAEDEVQAFLEKPRGMVKEALAKLQDEVRKEEGFEDFDMSIDELMSGTYGRMFLALTHFGMPDPQAGVPFPDIGLVLGVEGRKGAPNWQGVAKEMIGRAAGASGIQVGFQPVTADNYNYEEMTGGRGMRPPVLMGQVGDLQLFSISHESMKLVMDRVSGAGSAKSLADSANYRKAQMNIGIDSSSAVRVFVNTDIMFRTIAEGIKMGLAMENETEYLPLVDKLLDMSGLLALKSIAAAGVSSDGVAVGRSFVNFEGELKGMMKFSPATPLDPGTLAIIPKSVSNFSIFQLDLAAMYDFAMEVLQTVDGEAYQEAQQMIMGLGAQIAGDGNPPLNIRDDILGNIGPEFVFLQPQTSNAMVPSMLFLAKVQNADKVVASLSKLLEFGSMMSGGEFSLKTATYKGNPLYQVEVGAEMGVPLSPSFAVVDNRLTISLTVGDLKRSIRRSQKGGDSILENEEFQRFYSKVPQDADLLSLSYNDVKYGVESMYGQLVMALPMVTMASGIDLPVEMALLPTQETITQHLFSSLSYSMMTEGGVVSQSYSPIGGEALAIGAAAALGAGALAGMYAMEEAGSASFRDMEVAPPAPAQETTADQVRYDLSNLKAGVTIYKLQNNRLPDSLDQLLEPSDAYPQGCLGRDSVPADPWGSTYRYKTTERGYILWSFGPNGTDDSGAGDDIVVEKK